MIADSHCHLLDPRLSEKKDEIVKNFRKDGILFAVEISADSEEAVQAVSFANANADIYCTIGVHPSYADKYDDVFERWAAKAAAADCKQKKRKIVAVGECGLDYYHNDFPPEKQADVFTRQIKLADRLKLPLVVHTREAFKDTLEILQENRNYLNHGLLIHCFSGGPDEVRAFAELDAYFAFGGAVTYKNNKISAEAIRAAALDRILLETDAPYLSPEPLRGKTNEPKNIKFTAEYVARILNMTVAEIEKITLDNTKRFYGINN